ncbi:MAG: permease-like cell division protein FtsX [Bacteroidia bacterium]|nr:permease-like cell division protein FtsX [Bacteroidia bacterium]
MSVVPVKYPQYYLRRRSRSAYLTTMVSMALMLFFLGLFASYLLLGQKYAKRVEEAVRLDVQVLDGARPEDQDRLARTLKNASYTRDVEFISKEEALKEYQERFGSDITEPLGGVNPLPSSFRVKLLPQFIHQDSLERIREGLEQQVIVTSVEYPLEQILQLKKNLFVVAWLTLGIGMILLVIAFYLIFATIRLGIYAQRLAIRSMQLIGATDSFIRRPFLLKGLVQGGSAGILACLLLLAAWWMLAVWSPAPLPLWHLQSLGFIGLIGGIVLLGLLLGWVGSYLAVNRFLNKNLDQLMQE